MPDAGLHVGVDGRELVGRPTGVGRYVHGILRAWPDPQHRITVFVPVEPPSALRSTLGQVTWHVVPGSHAGTWWEQTRLPRALRHAGADVLFAPAYTAPLRAPCPFVVVIHDVSFFAHPEWFPWREGLRRRVITRWSARRAARVLTVSDFSAREIERWLRLPRHRLTLAPSGAPPVAPAPVDGARQPLILYVGSLFNRRHVPALLQAFAHVRAHSADARLVLVGDNRTHPRIDPVRLASDLGIAASVEWRAYVDDPALAELYTSARVFAFLSDYEGFAIPPMEAIAHGVPPVLLDTPVAREIYGEAARFVSPDPAAIGQALLALLNSPEARRDLVEAGRRRLARFTWARTAAVVCDALQAAARSR